MAIKRKGRRGGFRRPDPPPVVQVQPSPVEEVGPSMNERKKLDRIMRRRIVMWKKPLLTFHYFSMEILFTLRLWMLILWEWRNLIPPAFLLLSTFGNIHGEGDQQEYLDHVEEVVLWSSYWICLGILSSVGLGTGLQTFLLHLGPHIASVTMAAYECNSLNFPEPPYPYKIICPNKKGITAAVTLENILSKVRLEVFMWSVGTVIAELPSYFLAKAACVDADTEAEDDFPEEMGDMHFSCIKHIIKDLVKNVGFWGILIYASIPNPLLDLSGAACGHFQVPFWTFFGAIFIGKVIVKAYIQKVFVIMTFSKPTLQQMVAFTGDVPIVGRRLQKLLLDYLKAQKVQLRPKNLLNIMPDREDWVSWFLKKVEIVMVFYFILSVINSLAQRYVKRIQQQINRAQIRQ